MTKIEIWWNGPYTIEEVQEFNADHADFGIYQIYGTHNISGPNTLLYIGKADKQTFAKRIRQHDNWTQWEKNPVQVYLGKLGSDKPLPKYNTKAWDKYCEIWSDEIDCAERLLIFHCKPPYNTQFLQSYGNVHDTIVLNFDKRHRLPMEVSTFLYESSFWEIGWNVYGQDNDKFEVEESE